MKRTYEEALHAMQTGVAAQMSLDPPDDTAATSPKHLRVGVNSAMVDTGALISLLVKKGVFTKDEIAQEVTEYMNMEVDRYEEELSRRMGSTIHLK